jgi:dihydrolipoamide dehydrogenase
MKVSTLSKPRMMSSRPKCFDRNLIVIGAGSAGLVSAYIAAAVNAKVTLVEKHKMGGDCLNTGCVPSKALIKSAKVASLIKRAKEFGINVPESNVDFPAVMERVQSIITKVEPHDSVERFESLGVECIEGEARITSPWTVEINGKTLSARSMIIATGARPFVPPIKGIEQINYLTSDNLWGIRDLPKRLIVLGGGPIGCELTQAFSRLGSQVTQIEMLPRIMVREDEEIAAMITKRFQQEGVDIRTNHMAKEVVIKDNQKILICEHDNKPIEIEFDEILVAVGRAANTSGFGMEELGIELNPNKTIRVNEKLQTSIPNIFACGDVAGPYQFTHTAAHQAWYASVNALFGSFKKFKVDYSVIPWATFTDPEVARVGLNEQDAKEQGIDYEVTSYGIDDLDRAIAEGEDHGVVKVLTVPGKDKILGVTIIGDHAGELITEYISAMKHNFGMNKILGTIHIYPTLSEANKFAAGVWKKAHAPQALLKLVEKFHNWMRN